MEAEEIAWKQRSRVDWLRDGDKNTRYFHSRASQRRRKNHIAGVEDETGLWIGEDQGMEICFINYFQQLFSISAPTNIDEVLEAMSPVVTNNMNTSLLREVSFVEIKEVVFQLGAWKASGPDGFPALFYQTFWSTVGEGYSGSSTLFQYRQYGS